MNFIAIDTTSQKLTVCAEIDGELKVHRDEQALRHSTTLMPAIDRLLGTHKHDLDFVAVNIGPGSFTGIRIGVTTVKVMAWVLGIPVVAFTAHELLRGERKNCVTVIDGGNKVRYVQRVQDGIAEEIVQMTDTEFLEMTAALPQGTAVIGDGFSEELSGDAMAVLVKKKWKAGQTLTYVQVEPLYIQLSQAERELK